MVGLPRNVSPHLYEKSAKQCRRLLVDGSCLPLARFYRNSARRRFFARTNLICPPCARSPATRDRSRQPSAHAASARSEEHTSELQSLMRISYAVFCLKTKNTTTTTTHNLS